MLLSILVVLVILFYDTVVKQRLLPKFIGAPILSWRAQELLVDITRKVLPDWCILNITSASVSPFS